MFDFVRALDRRLFVDARILRCAEADFDDMIELLVNAGIVRESGAHADGKWHTGYALTLRGSEYAALRKADFVSSVVRPIVAGVAEGLASTAMD